MQFNSEDKEKLEAIIDTFGLFTVLEAISDICGDKAEHIELNWQDVTLAQTWDKAAAAIRNANARHIAQLAL